MGLPSRSNQASPQRCWRPQTLLDCFWLPPHPCQYLRICDSSHLACLLRSSLRLGFIGTTTSLASLASGFWTQTSLGLRFSTRSVPTLMSLSALIFVKGYFTVTLLSAPPLLSTPIHCLSQCSASILLQQAVSNKSSTLPRRHRRCLNPLLLLLNPLPPQPRRPGRHASSLLRNLQPMYFSSCRTTTASSCRLGYSSIQPRRLG
jgi:hypothetical protein